MICRVDYLLINISKKKIKVIFGGDGADEIFGGYQNIIMYLKKKLKLGIISPYSSNQSKNSKEFIVSENLFKRAYKIQIIFK